MSLNTVEIINEILKDKWGKKHFLGVFAFDQKPKIQSYPSCLVLNNQNHDQSGEHWIALYFKNKTFCDFFDSFGKNPDYYNLIGYIKKYSNSVNFSSFQIQETSSYFCGYYCIFFILLRSRNINFKHILKLFEKKNLKNNDEKIKNLLV